MKKAATKSRSSAGKPGLKKRASKSVPPPPASGSMRKASLPGEQQPEINPQIPLELLTRLDVATRSGKWLVAVFRVENEKLFLDRTAMNFPRADLDLASRLFVENVQSLKRED